MDLQACQSSRSTGPSVNQLGNSFIGHIFSTSRPTGENQLPPVDRLELQYRKP
ncbi:unnamed protein product [Rhodiola kirilowii]